MNIHISWYKSQQVVLHHQYVSPWTWDDLITAIAITNQHIARVGHPVHIIADFSRAPSIPANIFTQITHVLRQPFHPNWGKVLVVGTTQTQSSVLSVLSVVHPQVRETLILVENPEDIQQVLKELTDAHC